MTPGKTWQATSALAALLLMAAAGDGRRAAARADSERGQQPRLEIHDAGSATTRRRMSALQGR